MYLGPPMHSSLEKNMPIPVHHCLTIPSMPASLSHSKKRWLHLPQSGLVMDLYCCQIQSFFY
uniref:Uncharacterized protein n=1 Tax=Anguilla anguilla TaxID=7936 RepID=A0A0E9R6Y9_ANGAN